MELWIRSQDRETLMLANYFEIEQRDKNFLIMARNGDPYFDQCLGLYETKERALQILDEIQEAQLGDYHYKCPSNVKVSNNENTIVYEMPKE